jgi:hypothetical protein
MSNFNVRADFYSQFDQAVALHAAWCQTPEGTVSILRDPWKALPPVSHVSPPGSSNPKDILTMLRDRKAQQMAIDPNYGNVV